METDIRNSLETAEIISVSDRTSILTGSLSSLDNVDFFRFDLFRRSNLDLDLSRLIANGDVSLLNRNGKAIATSNLPDTGDGAIAIILNPGTYFIQVTTPMTGKNTPYSLSISATQAVPTVFNNKGLNLSSGETGLITGDLLLATVPQRQPAEIIYQLETIPENGRLDLNGNELAAEDYFTQADIDNGLLGYTNSIESTQITDNLISDVAVGISGDNVLGNVGLNDGAEVFLYDETTGDTVLLANNDVNDVAVGISGSIVVWNGFDGNDSEVFFYDSIAKTTVQLTDNNTEESAVAIDGNNVIWNRFSETTVEAFFYNGTTAETVRLQNDSGAAAGFQLDVVVAVEGDLVIWNGFNVSDAEVFLYDDSTQTTVQLTDNTIDDLTVDISGDFVIGNSFDGNDNEIFVYDLATATTTISTDNDTEDAAIAIAGNRIVWHGFDGNDTEVFVRDLLTGVTTQITDNDTDDLAVDLSKTHLVGNSFAGGSRSQVFVYNFATGTITQLTNTSNATAVGSFGTNVVWNESSSVFADSEVVLADLNNISASDRFSFNVADGFGGVTEELFFNIAIEI
ncbi:MAG: cadherin-like domain-containing protein [Pleurocapsa sp.]